MEITATLSANGATAVVEVAEDATVQDLRDTLTAAFKLPPSTHWWEAEVTVDGTPLPADPDTPAQSVGITAASDIQVHTRPAAPRHEGIRAGTLTRSAADCLTVSPCGRFIAAWLSDGTLTVWHTDTHAVAHTRPAAPASQLLWSPLGLLLRAPVGPLLQCGTEWDDLQTLEGQWRTMAYAEPHRTLFALSTDTLTSWVHEGGVWTPSSTRTISPGYCSSLAPSPHGLALYGGGARGVCTWDAAPPHDLNSVENRPSQTVGLVVSPCGAYVYAAGGLHMEVRVLEANGLACIRTLDVGAVQPDAESVQGLALSPCGRRLYCVTGESCATAWYTSTWEFEGVARLDPCTCIAAVDDYLFYGGSRGVGVKERRVVSAAGVPPVGSAREATCAERCTVA